MRPSDLDPERWRRIDEIFDAALQTPPAAREDFLDGACGGDRELREELETLLEVCPQADAYFVGAEEAVGHVLDQVSISAPEDRQVGSFRLVRELGRGGMGVVYLAEDTRLGRHVALKALPPYLGIDEEAKRRFVSEARAISALDHPNIATLYEVGETDEGQLYMVFAFYEGETLKARIERGPLPAEEAARIAVGIAGGLDAAHRAEIVHRDVKPSNVLLTASGDVKLLDFGVAKVPGEEVTGEHVRLGTVAYMSPEQATGASVDMRTDLWSLGVVLWEMLSGKRPFRGVNRSALVESILEDDPGPDESLPADLPDALKRAVRKLLNKDPRNRHADAGDLSADLNAVLTDTFASLPLRQPPSPPKTAGQLKRTEHGGGRPQDRRRLGRRAAVIVGLTALLGSAWWVSGTGTPGPRIQRLAVLPLENRTGDPEQQYFVDGVHEALISELGRIGALGVISRTSVMRYRSSQESIPDIARALEVDALVEGSVFRSGDSLAITTQLVTPSPERTLWSERYERTVQDVFGVAADVARSIATQASIDLSPSEDAHLAMARPVDPNAYDDYLLGQFHFEQRTSESFELARRYFTRALERDSTFAPAYAALAEAYGSGAFFGLSRPAEIIPTVEGLAENALRLDSTLAQAHATLAAVDLYWNLDFAGAERSARRAVALNPSQPQLYRRLAEVLSVTGRLDEALQAVERASDLDRFVQFAAFRPVVVLNYKRDFEEAIDRAREGLVFFEGFWQGQLLLCVALAGDGRYAEAIPECEAAVAGSGRNPMALGALGYSYGLGGRRAEARQISNELEERAARDYVGGSHIATVHVALGDFDRAIDWLERAYEERDMQLVYLDLLSFFDPLRSDPRFNALLERIGLME